jgi:hypothetical protein
MRTIDLAVEGDSLLVSDGSGRAPERLENSIVIRDKGKGRRMVDAIGSASESVEQPGQRKLRPFDIEQFDPSLAEAVVYYLLRKADGSMSALRSLVLVSRGTVRLRWPEWSRLAAEHRRSFVRLVGQWADLEVNGRIALHRTWTRSLLFQGPLIERWAVE